MKRKFCWIAKQYRKGWRLGLDIAYEGRFYLRGWFKCKEDIEQVLKGSVVYVHASWNKERV